MSRVSSSPAEPAPWAFVSLSWPIDVVPALLTVVHPRRLTPIEWGVLRVLQEFGGAPPTAQEAASELGIGDPSWLEETVRELLRLGALAARESALPVALENAVLTASGEELFRRGLVDGEPVQHGYEFHFDALADEPISLPKVLTPEPRGRRASDVVAPTRTTVGLDLARQFLSGVKTDLLRNGGELRRIEPRENGGARLEWTERRLAVDLGRAGVVARVPGGSARQNALAAEIDLFERGLLSRHLPRSEDVPGEVAATPPESGVGLEAWKGQCKRVLAPEGALTEATALIQGATKEVVVAACWLQLKGVRAAIDAAHARGVAVLVTGATELTSARGRNPGVFMLSCRSRSQQVCVVDAHRGFRWDEVSVVSGGKRTSMELVGELPADACPRLRAEIVGAALAEVTVAPSGPRETGQAESIALAALSLSKDFVWWRRVLDAVRPAAGVERLRAINKHALDALPYVHGGDLVELEASLAREWRAALAEPAVAQARPGPSGVRQDLFELAPACVGPTEAVNLLLDLAGAATRSTERGTIAFLVGLAHDVDDRWGDGKARSERRWQQAFEECLRLEAPLTAKAVDAALTRLRQEGRDVDLARGAEVILRRLPAPTSPKDLPRWIDLASRCRAAPIESVVECTLGVGRALLTTAPKGEGEILPLLSSLVPAASLGDLLLPVVPTLEDLVAVRARLDSIGIAVPATSWEKKLDTLLERLEEAAVADQGAFAGQVVVRQGQWRGLMERCQVWAKRVIERRQERVGVAALGGHAQLLAALRQLVGADFAQERLLEASQRVLRSEPLRGPAWTAVLREIGVLGFDAAAVAALASVAQPPPPTGRKPSRDSRAKRGRKP